jgi:hypothetical protein
VRITRITLASIAVASLVIVLSLSAKVAAPSPPQLSAATAATAATGLRFVSNDEYVAAVGVARAAANGITLLASSNTVRADDPQIHWWTIVYATKDSDGRDIPLRHGYSDSEYGGNGGGWAHACVDHDLCSTHVIATTFHEHPETRSGTRYGYGGVVIDRDLNVRVRVTSAQDQSRIGFYEVTPDNRPFGLVTAYCLGMARCPAWINDL